MVNSLEIVSIVGSGKLNTEFDLEQVSKTLDVAYCEYNPEKFYGVSIRFEQDGPAVALYRTGSYGVRGASSFDEIQDAQKQLLDALSELGIEIEHESDFQVTNVVFTSDLGYSVDLSKLSLQLGLESIEYDPEHFPGLVYRMRGGVLLIFSSGKVVLTGFRKRENAEIAYRDLQEQLSGPDDRLST